MICNFVIFLECVDSRACLSANDREVGWVANDIRLQPFCFSEATNLFGAFRDRP